MLDGIWILVPLTPDKTSKWLVVNTVKMGSNAHVDSFKTHLMTKGYMQNFGLDYVNTFFFSDQYDFLLSLSCHDYPRMTSTLV